MNLSIVIPTLNRAESLKKTLQSIVEQDISKDIFEVIVIDNGSTDDSRDVCKLFERQLKNFVYHYDDEPGQLTGRHKGTELSKGEIISFIDDDVELNPGWVRSILELFNGNEWVSIIGGPCLPKYQSSPPAWLNFFWQSTPYGGTMCLPLSLIDLGTEMQEIDPLYVFGLNYSIRKKVLIDLGGFNPDCIPELLQKYQGDGETGLSLKAKSRGIKALYASSAMLYHQVSAERMTAQYFEKWYYYSGVCQSFTNIKLSLNKDETNGAGEMRQNSIISRLINKTINVLKSTLKDKNRLPVEVVTLQNRFNEKYHQGYKFHQHNYNTDPSVKNWVLKNDYWNYKLPV